MIQVPEYTGPLPEHGPWKVVCKNLDKQVEQDELGYFFWDRELEPISVDYGGDLPRHCGVVEFKEKEHLKKAL